MYGNITVIGLNNSECFVPVIVCSEMNFLSFFVRTVNLIWLYFLGKQVSVKTVNYLRADSKVRV